MTSTPQALLRRAVTTLALLALVAPAAPAAPAAGAAGPAAAATSVILQQNATLTTHDAGFPKSPDPGRQIVRADVEVTPDDDEDPTWFYNAQIQLAGIPAREYDDAVIVVGFGRLSGNTCVFDYYDRSIETDGRYQQSRYSVGYYIEGDQIPAQPWDCTSVLVVDYATESVVYDAMTAPLVNTTGAPELTVRAPKKVRMVPGYWTDVEVKVANRGEITARDVVIKGKGRGVKVRPARLDAVSTTGDPTTVTLRVKLARKRKAPLKLVASAGSEQATARTTIGPKKPPKPPAPGKYGDGAVQFTITKGRSPKITAFSVRTRTTCGGFGTPPTYQMTTYDFPTTKIPGNGIVDRTVVGNRGGDAEFSIHLDAYVAGGKVTGRFSYAGPGTCRASEAFKLRR